MDVVAERARWAPASDQLIGTHRVARHRGGSDRVARMVVALLVVALSMSAWPARTVGQTVDCLADREPNDAPETAPVAEGPFCVDGDLTTGDQDLILWEVPAGAGEQAWSVRLTGVQGTLTTVRLLELAAPATDTPPAVGEMLLQVDVTPAATGPVTAPPVLLREGRYLLGISRTERPDGARPWTTGYAFEVVADTPPGRLDEPPTGGFSMTGQASIGQPASVEWTIPAAAGADAWHVEAGAPLGLGTTLALLDAEGQTLVTASTDDRGRVLLPDLALAAGTYRLDVSMPSDDLSPFRLVARTAAAGSDPEPNDLAAGAVPIGLSDPVRRGRLFPSNDRDRYRLEVPPEAEGRLLDVRVLSGAGVLRSLCLSTHDDSLLQCREGRSGAALTGLRLAAGTYLLTVAGDASVIAENASQPGAADETGEYLLRIDLTVDAPPDYETEPNDVPAFASPLDPAIVMRGRGTLGDPDVFRFEVDGDAQLWEVRAGGEGVAHLSWIRADGTQLAEAIPDPGTTEVRLTDLYLVPGLHHVRVAGEGDYEVRLAALGPPDPDAEREPNDSRALAEPVRLSRSRIVGRLPTTTDRDVYRFTLTGTERLAFRLMPPPDGAIDLALERDAFAMGAARSRGAGLATEYEALLGPGDYELALTIPPGGSDSQEPYELTLQRGDPFVTRDDEEPNDVVEQASMVGPDLSIAGTAHGLRDIDWYALPPTGPGVSLRVAISGAVDGAALSDGMNDLPVEYDHAAGTLEADGSLGLEPRFLRVLASGPYVATLGGDDLAATDVPPALSVRLEVTLADDTVAAYWPTGQRVDGVVEMRNEGGTPVELALEAMASHHGWRIVLDATDVTLEPGAASRVPLTVVVPPDAWADDPVLIHVRAHDALGAAVSAGTSLAPDREVAPVAPRRVWPLPDELLGGLDVASLALGAVPIPVLDPVGETALHDGLALAGQGLETSVANLPLTLTVDLAGSDPVSVAGFIVDPLAGQALAGHVPAEVELLLSTDGAAFQPVSTARLSTLMAEQAFVLDAPVPATHAQLRITSAHGGALGAVAIGEWKVVAVPGAVPVAGGLDIAAPLAGGHVAWMDPQPQDPRLGERLLDRDPTLEYAWLEPGAPLTLAVAFRAGRAARVERLEWHDPAGSIEAYRATEVDVALSQEGPAGPWVSAGRWRLERGPDGSVAPFDLPDAPWARAVLLRAGGPADGGQQLELPGTIAVFEHPIDETHRSVLGEWGAASPAGPFELLEMAADGATASPPDAGDSPDAAAVLAPGSPAAGLVSTDEDVDWYALTVPADDNSLSLEVTGRPTVAVALTLFDADGLRVPMLFGPGSRRGSVLYEAEVAPGADYRLEVRQPPASIVFTFDTSGSVAPFFEDVYRGLRAFSADIREGREAVLVMPFEEAPLLDDWSDQRYELQNAVDRFVSAGGSSSAEIALLEAATLLGSREGARAILVVTDAETTSFHRSTDLWRALASVRPLIFSVHVGGGGEPFLSTTFMQDWANVAGGVYRYAESRGEMERAFDRLATWLRRPATYELSLASAFREKPPPSRDPGTIAVVSAPGQGTRAVAADVGIEVVLDTSGSMLKRLGGQRRIDVARAALRTLISERLAPGTPLALRVFGGQGDERCESRLAAPLGPLDPVAMIGLVDALPVKRRTSTPIAAALERIPDDLAGVSGTAIVVLVTDGDETCRGDVSAAIADLERRGIDARVNIVGFAMDDRAVRRRMRAWARAGDGSYFDARGTDDLAAAIDRAIGAPFRVLDAFGNEVASGTADGDGVEVAPGTYSIVVLAEPVARFDGVIVGPGENVVRELMPPSAEGAAVAGTGSGSGTEGEAAIDASSG